MKRHVLSILLAASAQTVASAQEDEPPPPERVIGVVPRLTAFFGRLSGRLEADEATGFDPILDGSSYSLDSDLGVDDDKLIWMFEAGLIERRRDLYVERTTLSFWKAGVRGTRLLDEPVVYNGRTFPAGRTLETDWSAWSTGLDFTVYDDHVAGNFPVHGAFVLGLRYTEVKARLADGTQSTDERVRLLWPGLGFRFESSLTPEISLAGGGMLFFSLGEEIDPFGFQVEEWSGLLGEGSIGLRVSLGPVVAEAGMRAISSRIRVVVDDPKNFENNKFSFLWGGPYLSATIRF
ncbi:MAG: hypothetical protein HY716_03230 [Planctomycetes bacterium]|nr:hypothetical protein [Planctomycetota bacterium]